MNLKTNGDSNGRQALRAPWLRVALLVIAVLVVAVLLYRQIDRLRGPRRTVWVAGADLEAGSVVATENLESKRVREKRLPQNALGTRQEIEGRKLAEGKSAGAPFVPSDFALARKDLGSITSLVPEGRVLMTVRTDARSAPFPELRRGDRLNVLAVLPGGGAGGSVASDAYFLGWIQPRSDSASKEKGTIFGVDIRPPGRTGTDGTISLLLALHPEHVLPLARAEGAGAKLNFVLHGSSEIKDGQLLVLPGSPGPHSVEVITGSKRDTLEFGQ